MADYIHRDPLLAVAVIGVMASQASHARSEVRARIEAQILTAAEKLNDAELEAEKKELVSDLILAGTRRLHLVGAQRQSEGVGAGNATRAAGGRRFVSGVLKKQALYPALV